MLDLVVWPGDSMLVENAVKAAAAIVHQDPNNILIVFLPTYYAGCNDDSVLKHVRLLEDKLMSANLNIHRMITAHYEMPDDSGRDSSRTLTHLVRACTSKSFPEKDSAWMSAKPLRGKLERIPLCRIRDMVGYDESLRPTPAQRTLQRGIDCWIEILKNFAHKSDFTAKDKIIIAELLPNPYGEVIRAVHKLQMETMTTSANLPSMAYVAGSDKIDMVMATRAAMKGSLMEGWWEAHPKAGPKQRPHENRSNLVSPNLKILGMSGEKPIFPEALLDKFPSGSGHHSVMLKLKEKHLEKFPASFVRPALPPTNSNSLPALPTGAGPDYSIHPGKNLEDVFDLETMSIVDLEKEKDDGNLCLGPSSCRLPSHQSKSHSCCS